VFLNNIVVTIEHHVRAEEMDVVLSTETTTISKEGGVVPWK
jgi:hypothetical protein